ncbi:DUF2165 family protein [uncultured Thiodictyon sp.]|uniref:DUF2165 family protein n=1 Tax=uncultured Thiodictyon sp. TaxID=1846217 RepID=UPI0034236C04
MYTRSSKALLVWAVAFYVSLVVLENLMDYGSNYTFVCHVLKCVKRGVFSVEAPPA